MRFIQLFSADPQVKKKQLFGYSFVFFIFLNWYLLGYFESNILKQRAISRYDELMLAGKSGIFKNGNEVKISIRDWNRISIRSERSLLGGDWNVSGGVASDMEVSDKTHVQLYERNVYRCYHLMFECDRDQGSMEVDFFLLKRTNNSRAEIIHAWRNLKVETYLYDEDFPVEKDPTGKMIFDAATNELRVWIENVTQPVYGEKLIIIP